MDSSLQKGLIVKSRAGKDKDTFLVVVDLDESGVYVCDGKYRPLDRPKKKNTKHIILTKKVLSEDAYSTNKKIKKALGQYRRFTYDDQV